MKGWSPEEDQLLLQLIEAQGKRWKVIAEALGRANDSNPRTPAMVRQVDAPSSGACCTLRFPPTVKS